MNILIVVAVLVASAHASLPTCPTTPMTQTTRFHNFAVDQHARCGPLCDAASCVGSPKLLGPLVRCLNITASSTLDFSDLKKQKDGICLSVQASVIVKKPLKLGEGDDCVIIYGDAAVGDIYTGGGDDFVYLLAGASAHNIDLGSGEDIALFNDSVVVNKIIGGPGRDFIFRNSSTGATGIIGSIELGDGGDFVNLTNTRINRIDGNAGSDIVYLTNSSVEKELDVGGASDFVFLTSSNVTKLDGGGGDNIFKLSAATPLNNIGEIDDDDDDSASLVCM